MQLNVIKVGNSKGIRLPKSIIDEYKIDNCVELVLKSGYFELRPIIKPRLNWTRAFQKMTLDENEESLLPDFFEDEEI